MQNVSPATHSMDVDCILSQDATHLHHMSTLTEYSLCPPLLNVALVPSSVAGWPTHRHGEAHTGLSVDLGKLLYEAVRTRWQLPKFLHRIKDDAHGEVTFVPLDPTWIWLQAGLPNHPTSWGDSRIYPTQASSKFWREYTMREQHKLLKMCLSQIFARRVNLVCH